MLFTKIAKIITGIVVFSVMGNAGDRKGQGGPSGVKKPEEKCEHYMEFGQGGTLLNYHVPGLVVYSPSHNPRAYQSPSNPEVNFLF